jgi:hypothetical protein
MSCAGKGKADRLAILLPEFQDQSGEITGGRSGIMSSVCKQALTLAIAKGFVDAARELIKFTCVDVLDLHLAQCAARNENEILKAILGALKR